jgi:hypothetical protein
MLSCVFQYSRTLRDGVWAVAWGGDSGAITDVMSSPFFKNGFLVSRDSLTSISLNGVWQVVVGRTQVVVKTNDIFMRHLHSISVN